MLADSDGVNVQSGGFSPDLHRPKTWLHQLITFILEELPSWRDRGGRPTGDSETQLTSQLCAHLNGTTRKSPGWDVLQFRIEEPDETKLSRRIDLVAAPAGEVIWIEGRRHDDFDTLLPIECKRLPTPKGKNRDKREYLRVANGSTGGVQRFKAGLHGAAHEQAVMIAYVQTGGIVSWINRLDFWIRALSRVGISGWSLDDRLNLVSHDTNLRIAVLSSEHERELNLNRIELRHLWVEM
ncbi:hypothetical protein B0E33_30465 (plasmid) [Roseibium algicola]|uniref:Uncharacterized protein n=1 Tax=Roseibium algicola TaxID=2857014 RepID=A0ABN4X1U9_9HYPH|nr:hypothetical protein [Roseibium aggregatum]AQQ08151.1 hypothetical protein B0E33_30465 [Roseibium aggregatum]